MDNLKNSPLSGLIITPLKKIETQGGDVLHAIKESDNGFFGFGEAYFSRIDSKVIKGWKRHRKMTMNLIVPIGRVRFVIYDNRDESKSIQKFHEVILDSEDKYNRLTVPPLLWVAFQGLCSSSSCILNVANIEHSSEEVDRKDLAEIKYNWEL